MNLLRLQDAWTAYDRRTETKKERKRRRTTKRYTSNSLNLVEDVTPQILFLDTKPFVIRGTQRECSSKPLKHSIVKRILAGAHYPDFSI